MPLVNSLYIDGRKILHDSDCDSTEDGIDSHTYADECAVNEIARIERANALKNEDD